MSHPILAAFPPEVQSDLQDVEQRLQKQASSRDPDLSAWSSEPLQAGGKRVRPLLLLTAFRACAQEPTTQQLEHAKDAAVALELVHTASLVHDDIMDQAATRRGQPTTVAAHGLDGAILVGDYLFTQAFALAAALPKGAMALTADACRRLCEGQLREQRLQSQATVRREEYASVIRDKTAVLLSAACGIGASMAGADDQTVENLQRYGTSIGQAFQVLDDVLDVTGDPRWTGKPAGTDYLEGTMSSPFLHHLQRGGSLPATRRLEDFPELRRKLFEDGSIAASQLEAATYTQDALLRLSTLPPSSHRDALARLAEILMERSQ